MTVDIREAINRGPFTRPGTAYNTRPLAGIIGATLDHMLPILAMQDGPNSLSCHAESSSDGLLAQLPIGAELPYSQDIRNDKLGLW